MGSGIGSLFAARSIVVICDHGYDRLSKASLTASQRLLPVAVVAVVDFQCEILRYVGFALLSAQQPSRGLPAKERFELHSTR